MPFQLSAVAALAVWSLFCALAEAKDGPEPPPAPVSLAACGERLLPEGSAAAAPGPSAEARRLAREQVRRIFGPVKPGERLAALEGLAWDQLTEQGQEDFFLQMDNFKPASEPELRAVLGLVRRTANAAWVPILGRWSLSYMAYESGWKAEAGELLRACEEEILTRLQTGVDPARAVVVLEGAPYAYPAFLRLAEPERRLLVTESADPLVTEGLDALDYDWLAQQLGSALSPAEQAGWLRLLFRAEEIPELKPVFRHWAGADGARLPADLRARLQLWR